MNDLIWFLIGLAIIAGIAVGIYRWKTGALPRQIDRDGDNKLF